MSANTYLNPSGYEQLLPDGSTQIGKDTPGSEKCCCTTGGTSRCWILFYAVWNCDAESWSGPFTSIGTRLPFLKRCSSLALDTGWFETGFVNQSHRKCYWARWIQQTENCSAFSDCPDSPSVSPATPTFLPCIPLSGGNCAGCWGCPDNDFAFYGDTPCENGPNNDGNSCCDYTLTITVDGTKEPHLGGAWNLVRFEGICGFRAITDGHTGIGYTDADGFHLVAGANISCYGLAYDTDTTLSWFLRIHSENCDDATACFCDYRFFLPLHCNDFCPPEVTDWPVDNISGEFGPTDGDCRGDFGMTISLTKNCPHVSPTAESPSWGFYDSGFGLSIAGMT